jgi:hypothetical protein
MSRAKAPPNQLLRKSQKDRPAGSVRSNVLQRASLKKLDWLEIASNQPGVAIPVKLAPVIVGIMMAVIMMSAVSIVRVVIRSGVIPVRRTVTVGIISVIGPDRTRY